MIIYKYHFYNIFANGLSWDWCISLCLRRLSPMTLKSLFFLNRSMQSSLHRWSLAKDMYVIHNREDRIHYYHMIFLSNAFFKVKIVSEKPIFDGASANVCKLVFFTGLHMSREPCYETWVIGDWLSSYFIRVFFFFTFVVKKYLIIFLWVSFLTSVHVRNQLSILLYLLICLINYGLLI